MQDFFFVELISDYSRDIPAEATADVDLELLGIYIEAGGGPVPGQPEWRFTVDWQGQGGFFAILRVGQENVMPLIGGIALTEAATDSMWENLEGMRLVMYQSMAKAYGHNIPDEFLGNPSQPTTLPWVGSLLLGAWVHEYPELTPWLIPFQLQLAAAIISLKY